MAKSTKDPAERLAKQVEDRIRTGKESNGRLETDDRVLARITDGIYRQPASALRELISNAYDADATEVYVTTDVPRFGQITISDNGNGLSTRALTSLVHHIGGSPKRTRGGADLGVVSKKDPSLSPKGRKLIGKIGIGLFSVAQLTHHFQIVTKERGKRYRLVADLVLKTYSEEELAKFGDQRQTFETGSFRIWAVDAKDTNAHGTEIVLLDLRPHTRELLQSRERWQRVAFTDESGDDEETELPEPPAYHIGSVDSETGGFREEDANLPWDHADDPRSRFRKLHQAVLDEFGATRPKPTLDDSLDTYLKTLWNLGLSSPVDYIDEHPFEFGPTKGMRFFSLSNSPRGRAEEVKLKRKETVRDRFELTQPQRGSAKKFQVIIDGVQLLRPLTFTDLPKTDNAIKDSLMFVGSCAPNLDRIPKDVRGGPLAFEAYFFWNPKIIPVDRQGVLVRIGDASGTLFDETFMKYPISEQVRLAQITAEVFVTDGLDPALNIDRESFNFAHHHYVFLQKWIHQSLRHLVTRHKAIGAEVRGQVRKRTQGRKHGELRRILQEELELAAQTSRRTSDTLGVEVRFVAEDDEQAKELRDSGILVFGHDDILGVLGGKGGRAGKQKQAEAEIFELRMKSLAQLLEAYGVLDKMSYKRQQAILRGFARVFTAGDD